MEPLSWKTRLRHILRLHEKGKDNQTAPQFWRDWRDAFCEPLRLKLEEVFSVRGSSIANAIVYDQPGYELVPHTDMAHRLITAVFYLPADESTIEQGTVIMRGKKGDPEGYDKAFGDEFEAVTTLPYVPNSALFFQRTDWSYHAVRKTTVPRWTLSLDVLR